MYEPFTAIMQKIINRLTTNSLHIRFIKFGIIGLSGIVINNAVLWFLHTYIGLDLLFASPLAIAVAIFNNFSWNDRFTWKGNRGDRHNTYSQRLWKYYFSAALGAFLNYLVLILLTLQFDLYYLMANFAGILAGMVSNFLFSELWVFKSKKESR